MNNPTAPTQTAAELKATMTADLHAQVAECDRVLAALDAGSRSAFDADRFLLTSDGTMAVGLDPQDAGKVRLRFATPTLDLALPLSISEARATASKWNRQKQAVEFQSIRVQVLGRRDAVALIRSKALDLIGFLAAADA